MFKVTMPTDERKIWLLKYVDKKGVPKIGLFCFLYEVIPLYYTTCYTMTKAPALTTMLNILLYKKFVIIKLLPSVH